jgi:Ras GTPase-activating protein 1
VKVKFTYHFQIECSKKEDSLSAESEDGTFPEPINIDNDFDLFLDNIPGDLQDTEEPENINITIFTAPPENQ